MEGRTRKQSESNIFINQIRTTRTRISSLSQGVSYQIKTFLRFVWYKCLRLRLLEYPVIFLLIFCLLLSETWTLEGFKTPFTLGHFLHTPLIIFLQVHGLFSRVFLSLPSDWLEDHFVMSISCHFLSAVEMIVQVSLILFFLFLSNCSPSITHIILQSVDTLNLAWTFFWPSNTKTRSTED